MHMLKDRASHIRESHMAEHNEERFDSSSIASDGERFEEVEFLVLAVKNVYSYTIPAI